MTTTQNVDVAVAVRLRHRQDVDRRDELRTLRRLAATMTQTQIAKELRISQPAVNKALKAAGRVPDVREGFSGASPYEIAERYAAGQIDRAQLVEELMRWPYAEQTKTDGFDWLVEEAPGTFEEVGRALDEGLIDDETYDAVLAAKSGR
ncbi:MarR family transcriptional regulator [Oerskovia turbata]|uniref:MarR family transcriptional regulator n=1 Tax=Oerskovia turbata TaxID=1713 RepID=A0A4Q1KRI6_9CELL|nr:MarR family transcriptional regulator [Oerskovia turbata]RXR31949.1 MarR family transcriptional regulator [Oerskovia turbata]TGJ96934.1 MarR family transcriptional regulator [Actinotalea fermentans ATCC 43279 = JCM 9966 = DSM 3133]